METKDLKILWNIMSKWISMISLSKVAFEEFKILIVKMDQKAYYDALANEIIATNQKLLCDLDTIIALTNMIPKLQVVQGLKKYVQN